MSFLRGIGLDALLAAALAATAGCGGDGVPREAVSGRVTFKGAPLDKASIQFMPANLGVGSSTSAEVKRGEFLVPRDRGPTPGNYKVMISSIPDDGGPATGPPGAPSKPEPEPIPKKYNAETILTVEVKAGGLNEFEFDLDEN